MADVATVSFSGSSAETIEKAKAFWKCINPPPEQKSTLAVRRFVKTLFLNISPGTKQLTSRKRSCITLNFKLAALPLTRSMESKRSQLRRRHSSAKLVFDESAEGQSLID